VQLCIHTVKKFFAWASLRLARRGRFAPKCAHICALTLAGSLRPCRAKGVRICARLASLTIPGPCGGPGARFARKGRHKWRAFGHYKIPAPKVAPTHPCSIAAGLKQQGAHICSPRSLRSLNRPSTRSLRSLAVVLTKVVNIYTITSITILKTMVVQIKILIEITRLRGDSPGHKTR
jgi:hypothetical protein